MACNLLHGFASVCHWSPGNASLRIWRGSAKDGRNLEEAVGNFFLYPDHMKAMGLEDIFRDLWAQADIQAIQSRGDARVAAH